ncbi:MAG: 2-oxopent-4-enoate hydratase, partial [Betaproteobacteria bacterium]|nr:2-oxopent-4-enoate hydratase [Betaproteobacteria bacterium]
FDLDLPQPRSMGSNPPPMAAASMQMWKNNAPAGAGLGSAVQGHPAEAVAWLANTLGRLGIALEAGEVVMSGSLAIMVPVAAGDNLRVTIGGIGSCSVRFV